VVRVGLRAGATVRVRVKVGMRVRARVGGGMVASHPVLVQQAVDGEDAYEEAEEQLRAQYRSKCSKCIEYGV
jgi:hypothetical protein